MKFKLAPLARPLILCAATVSSPAFSQSSVTLYGNVDEAIVYANNQNGHSNVYMRQGNLYASKFGLKGTEVLSPTLRAIFDLQQGFDPGTGAEQTPGLAFNRYAYVGLQDTQIGTLTMGRQYTPYYLLMGVLGPVTYLTGATGAHPADIDGFDTDIRANNSVTYASPAIYGIRGSVQYGFGGVPGSVQSGSLISAALRYDGGPLAAGVGYIRMYNTGNVEGSFDPNASAQFSHSVVNNGYLSARVVQHLAAAANYTLGNIVFGLNYSNVIYQPDGHSLFSDTAVFNTYGALVSYKASTRVDLAAGYSFTHASSANGIDDAARYQQVSLKELYHLSQRTTLYALQAFQHASGHTLGIGGSGDIIDARPAVGDSQNTTPSSTPNQFVAMFGLAIAF
ncbi:porin [Paraburkholderia sp. MMS20-SJTR3]|uniref:Porin n=1 Tax=Paraburkholderia sejongensis TaxID=2886946 RepID=A0ABS8JT13_9BURK|nr:porin [Paraburkholderia sp. MMS20-SJTR3]MCC8392889.1 porin [Paraburkholderia sp. MMS20-SJTR3]